MSTPEHLHSRPRGPRGFGSSPDRRGRPSTTGAERAEIRAWLIGNLIDGWFVGPADVQIDDFEILIVGELANVDSDNLTGNERSIAEAARIERFREDTRSRRMEIASDAESRFSRKVSWGASIGTTRSLFTTTSVPVMTRLHFRERRVLDTLVDAGVARSRSEALVWCVELVARNEGEWIERLREALQAVETAREDRPESTGD